MHYYTLALLQSDLLDLDLQAKTRDKSLWTSDLRIWLVIQINIFPVYLV